MEHETGSGWTGSPAHVSDDANGGNEASRESVPSAGSSAELGDDPAPAAAEARDEAAPVAAGASNPATPATGEPRVDAALRLLERLPGLPVAEHPQLFEQVHAELSDVLGELDSGPGAGPVGR
jgi:hypothetical protein